jgi:WD40 repeat protein
VEDAVSIAFSPEGQMIATGSFDGTVRLWDSVTGELLKEAREHFQQVQRLVFTPDGTRLVSGSQDGIILLWGIPDSDSP